MSHNTFGHMFRMTSFGESHGPAIGCIVDGCPPGMALSEADIQVELDRRKPGTSRHVTQRQEPDRVEILSGVFEGRTLGTPIALWVANEDQRSEAYTEMATKFRPSHADYTYQAKYGMELIETKIINVHGTLEEDVDGIADEVAGCHLHADELTEGDQAAPVLGVVVVAERVELLEDDAGTARDAGERVVGDVDGHLGRLGDPLVHPGQEGAAAGEHGAHRHHGKGDQA